jgi:hypothetical protein
MFEVLRLVWGSCSCSTTAFACRNHFHQSAHFALAALQLCHFAQIFAIADLHVAEFDFYKVEQGFDCAF